MEKPVEWVWYGRDNDGESHISLGRWKRHSCQMRYKLAEIQPTEHDRAIPDQTAAIMRVWAEANKNYADDAEFLNAVAAIREAALREALDAVSRAAWKHNGDDSYSAGLEDGARNQNEADYDAILTMIGEKK